MIQRVCAYLFYLLIPFTMYAQDDRLKNINKLITNEEYAAAITQLEEINKTGPSPEIYRLLVKAYADYGWSLQMNGQDGSEWTDMALEIGKGAIEEFPDGPAAHIALGYAYQFRQQFVQAQASYQKAVDLDENNAMALYYLWMVVNAPPEQKVESELIKEALRTDPNLADAWEKLGDIYRQLEQPDQAIYHYEKAVEIAPHYLLYYNIGNCHLQKGATGPAIRFMKKSVELKPEFAWGHYGVGMALLYEGKTTEAAGHINNAVETNPAVWDYVEYLVQQYPQLGEYGIKKPGNKELNKSREAFNPGPDKDYMEGVNLAQNGKYADAANTLYDFVKNELEKDGPNYAYVISSKNWISHCLFMLGKYADALQYAESNFIDTRDYGLPSDLASLMASTGAIYSEWGDHITAILFTERSIELLKELGMEDELAIAYSNLCDIRRAAGDYSGSVEAGKEALRRSENTGSHELVVQNHNNLAVAYLFLGSTYQVSPLIEKGLELADDLEDDKWTGELYFTRAQYLNSQGQYKEALEWFQKAREILDKIKDPLHPDYQRIRRAGACIYINLDRPEKAREEFTAMFDLWAMLIQNYFPAMSETGKVLFYRSLTEDFEVFNNFVVRFSDRLPALTEDMYNHQVLIKGLLLNTSKQIRNLALESDDQELRETYQAWQDARALLAKEHASRVGDKDRVIQLGYEIEGLESKLSRMSGLFEKQKRRSADWKDVKNTLEDDAVAVEMTKFRAFDFRQYGKFGKNVYYAALTVDGDSQRPSLVVYENGRDLEDRHFRGYSNSIRFRTADRQSWDAFWKPLDGALKDKQTVYFSPEGVFHKINLEGLLNPGDGSWLADSKSVRLITGPADLLQKDRKEKAPHTAVLFGYPDYKMEGPENTPSNSDEDLQLFQMSDQMAVNRSAFGAVAELPGTLKEVERIETTLKSNGWEVSKYIGRDANEKALKETEGPGVLHIATHGYFNKKDTVVHPLLSGGLLLAGAATDRSDAGLDQDGILTAWEAMDMRLDDTQLVVLSACETGQGVVENGEGVYGLQSALLFAGARYVMMSLWKIDDQATQELMTAFYQDYAKSGDPYTAFKTAQKELREKYRDPYYWAAFVILGK